MNRTNQAEGREGVSPEDPDCEHVMHDPSREGDEYLEALKEGGFSTADSSVLGDPTCAHAGSGQDGEGDRSEEVVENLKSQAMRAQADLENYRRRAATEREELLRFGQSQLILKVLGVADDFERALAHIPEDAVAPGWREGLELVGRRIEHLLETEGVVAIDALGAAFDPAQHEAVSFVETADTEAGKVASVIRQGYMLRDRVIRATQVVVAKAPSDSENDEKEAGDA